MSDVLVARTVAGYWDANRKKSLDENYWMAYPACRQAINRRIGGDPNEWPLEWFKRTHATSPFQHGVSWGCGLGAFERSLIELNLTKAIDAFDISEQSLAEARSQAASDGLSGINYRLGNFDDPQIARGRYDIVFFQSSLHHVARLGKLFRRMATRLRRNATVYAHEYVGPSQMHWTPAPLKLAESILHLAPPDARLADRVLPPLVPDDPSEAVRSDEIRSFLEDYFEITAWRPFGGQLAGLVFPLLDPTWLRSDDGDRFIGHVLQIEDEELRRDPATTHHVVAVGILKSLPANAFSIARGVGRELWRRARLVGGRASWSGAA